jgi:hypothetical protein
MIQLILFSQEYDFGLGSSFAGEVIPLHVCGHYPMYSS